MSVVGMLPDNYETNPTTIWKFRIRTAGDQLEVVIVAPHRQLWAAAGPYMANANLLSLVSWVNLIIEHTECMEYVPAGIARHLPVYIGDIRISNYCEIP